ncbi:hypothetical protein RUM44_004617 [Polyplax serrata]|uniref:Uncharacterized protein n=1 Tax=Polyplax serrata TaxID=468196 RepID=A0ABR1B3E8_POLSC
MTLKSSDIKEKRRNCSKSANKTKSQIKITLQKRKVRLLGPGGFSNLLLQTRIDISEK